MTLVSRAGVRHPMAISEVAVYCDPHTWFLLCGFYVGDSHYGYEMKVIGHTVCLYFLCFSLWITTGPRRPTVDGREWEDIEA